MKERNCGWEDVLAVLLTMGIIATLSPMKELIPYFLAGFIYGSAKSTVSIIALYVSQVNFKLTFFKARIILLITLLSNFFYLLVFDQVFWIGIFFGYLLGIALAEQVRYYWIKFPRSLV